MKRPIIFYDGMCGLCDGLVQFVLRHDRHAVFRFAPLQSALASNVLLARGLDPADLTSVYVLIDDRVLRRAKAVLFVVGRLGMPWAALSLLRALPGPILDLGYRLVARFRYQLFGRYDACPGPDPRWRDRFIEA